MTMPTEGQTDSRDATVTLRGNVDPYVASMNQAEVATNRTASAVDQLDAKLKGLSQRVSQGLVHFAERDFAGLAVGVATAATFDKQLGTLNATAAVTDQRMSGIKGAVSSTFTTMATSRTSVIQLIEVLNNLGVTGSKQLGQLAQTFIKLGEATGQGPSDLAQGLVQLSRLMGVTDARQIGNYANSLLTVSKNAGVSATGVLSFAQAIAPLARQAGIGEAAVLGISTAFSKAGADGFVAANTFNSIVSDITKLTQSGSPELAKYANLIGVTQKQFKSMDKTTALEQIFTTISKQGPEAINTLNRLGIDGVRAQSAIAAVVQSGDLNKQVSTALGSAGNQDNLNKGAHAATDNLSDDLVKIRNQLTQFGTVFGETFMKPLKLGAEAVEGLLSALNTLFKPIAPLVAGFAAVAGAVAGLAGGLAALGHVVGLGALAAFFVKGAPLRAGREGFAAGRGVAGESAEARTARLAANPSAVRYAAGGMPLRARIPYVIGRAAGGLAGEVDPNAPAGGPGALRVAARAAVRAPGLMVGAAARGQAGYLNNATRADYDRTPYAPVAGAARRTFAVGSSGEAAVVKEETAVRKGAISATRDWIKVQVQANRESVETDGVLKAFGKTVVGATRDIANLGLTTGRAATRLVRGVPGSSPIAGAGAAEGDVASRGALGRIAGVGKGALGAVGGPLGAALIGSMFLPTIMDHLKGPAETDTSGSNAITKYNEALGTTATNLDTFATAVDSAATKLNNIPGNATLGSVGKVTTADEAKAGAGFKATDKNFDRLASAAPKNTSAAVSYIQGLALQNGGMDPKTLQKIKEDLISAYGNKTAQTILTQYLGTNPGNALSANVDYGTLGAASRTGSGNKTFNSVSSQVFSAIGSQGQIAPGRQSSRAQLSDLLNYTGSALKTSQGGGNTANIKQVRALLAKEFGGKAGDYDALTSTDTSGSAGADIDYSDPTKIQGRVIQALSQTKQGRQFLKSAGVKLPSSSLGGRAYDSTLAATVGGVLGSKYPGPQATQLSRDVTATGPLGAYAETNKTVQSAYSQPDNPALQYSAMLNLYNKAGGDKASPDKVAGAFDKLTGTINDTTDQLYIMARAAKSYAAQQEQYALPYMSRAGQFKQVSSDYRQAQITQRDNPTADSAADLANARGAYQTQLQTQTQFEIQSLQTARAYGVQMRRSAEDYQTQISRSDRDFGIQMEQQQQDRNLQLERGARDHSRQLSQQNAVTAQTIYNPTQRVQSQYTASGDTLEQNLVDQNTRLRRQKKELDALKAAGLSLQAIQTLDLANPNNAQQLDRLMADVQANPGLIGQYNAQTATRVKLTKSLTQNDFNLGFQQTETNYHQGLTDAAHDYDTQRQRAVEAQHRSLSDMATDFNRMVRRSAEDLTTQMTELYGSFGDNYARTLAAINRNIGKYAPGIAKTLVAEIKAMQADIANAAATPVPGVGNSVGKSTHDAVNGTTTPGHAMGVISTVEHTARISEGGHPEMVLPLDARGAQFMSGMYQSVSMSVVKSLAAKGYASQGGGGSAGGGGGNYRVDNSTNYSGPITVQASDPDEMGRKLQAKQRLNRLTSPAKMAGSLS